MKNIQIIDGAVNCVYDIFESTEEEFSLIFPNQQDIEFIEDLEKRVSPKVLDSVFAKIWKRRLPKKNAMGIHGILFYELYEKKEFYPTKKDEEARNPDGTKLRA